MRLALGLSLATTRFINGSSAPAGDPNANAFFSYANITDPSQQAAITDLVTGLKADGLWSMIPVLYPFVGGTVGPHAKNLISDTKHITWQGSNLTHSANGVTGGTNSHGICNFTPLSLGDYAGASVYVHTPDASSLGSVAYYTGATAEDIGSGLDSHLAISVQPGTPLYRAWNRTKIITRTGAGNPNGLLASNRTSASAFTLHRNGAPVLSNSVADAVPYPNINQYILAYNFEGSVAGRSDATIALAAFHTGMNDTQAAAFYARVQAFQTALGRNV